MPQIYETYLFRLEANPPAYVWSGVGPIVIGGDTYQGMGEMLNLPDVEQLINGTADRVDFSVSGVDAGTLRLALDDRDTVDGAAVYILSQQLDEFNQLIGSPEYEWEGIADVVSVDSQSDESGNRTRTITLSVGAGDTGRSRSDLTFFTDADQRKRSLTDAFFSHIGGISAGTTRRFGVR